MRLSTRQRLGSAAAFLILACAPSCLPEDYVRPDDGDASAGAAKGSGGKGGNGGATSGGAVGKGGSGGGSSGGSGGSSASGGSSSSGGASSVGGTQSSGGAQSSGGTRSTGGAPATGGTAATGGAPATGGKSSTGGRSSTGGASSTGGKGGSAGAATGGAAGGSSCAQGRLCEDFETTDVDAIPQKWEKAAGAGTIGVATGNAHGGNKSLKVTAPSGSYETYMVNKTIFDSWQSNKIYGRLFFKFTARRHTTNADGIMHWTLAEARGAGSDNRVRYGGIENTTAGTNKWIFNVEGVTGDPHEAAIDDDGADINAGNWICVEWKFDGTTGANDTQLWQEGTEHQKMHANQDNFFNQQSGKFAIPDMNQMYVGWALYQPSDGPYEVYIDDLALDDVKIGCQ